MEIKSTFVETMKILKGFQPPLNDSLPVYSPMPSIEYFPPDFGALSPAQSPAYQSPKNKPAYYFSGCQQDDDAVSPSTVSLTPQSLVKSVKCNDKYNSKSSSVLDEDVSSDDSSDSDAEPSAESPLKQRNISTVRRKRQLKEKRPEIIYPITELFSPTFLEKCKKKGVSRPNLATILVKNFFKKEVRMTSNVNGKQGKNKLNPEMIGAIKVATFRMWPLESIETDEIAWRKCRKAINSAGHQLTCKSSKLDGKEN